MRRVVIVLALLIVASVTYGQFRGYEWGTDRATVRQDKGEPMKEIDVGLIYAETVLDSESFVGYTFKNGRLISGIIRMPDGDEYRVVAALDAKYRSGDYIEGVIGTWSGNGTEIMMYRENGELYLNYISTAYIQEQKRKQKAKSQEDADEL